MNVNTGLLNLQFFKQNKYKKNNYFSNALKPLSSDTLSFSGKAKETISNQIKDSVNLNWIDDSGVQANIKKIMQAGGFVSVSTE